MILPLPLIAWAACNTPTEEEIADMWDAARKADAATASAEDVSTSPSAYGDASVNANWAIFDTEENAVPLDSSSYEDAFLDTDIVGASSKTPLGSFKVFANGLCAEHQFIGSVKELNGNIYSSCSSFADTKDHALWVFPQGGEAMVLPFEHRLNQIVVNPDDPTELFGMYHDTDDITEQTWGVVRFSITDNTYELYPLPEVSHNNDTFIPNYAAGIMILAGSLFVTTSNLFFDYDDSGDIVSTYKQGLLLKYPIQNDGSLGEASPIFTAGTNATSLGKIHISEGTYAATIDTGLINLNNETSESYLNVIDPATNMVTSTLLPHGGLGVANTLTSAGPLIATPSAVSWMVYLHDVESGNHADLRPPAIQADELHYTSLAEFFENGDYLIACAFSEAHLDDQLGSGSCGLWEKAGYMDYQLVQALNFDTSATGIADMEPFNNGVIMAHGGDLIWAPFNK